MSDSEFFSKTDFSFTDTFTDIRKIYSSDTGFTEVYVARKALKRFALKALKPEVIDDPFYIGLLRKEFEIGFRLEHPCIVHTYSFEEVDDLGPCIVMEWIEGETLAWHLSNPTLDDQTWRNVVMELCDTLEYLKARQIVHRDLKPSNIMLTHDGNLLKLIDFGFADSPEYGSLKHSGGTRDFAAPEQLSNSEIKSTTDIFALGKVMEILPIKKNKRVRRLIARMGSEHPEERPQSAAEIKTEFTKASSRGAGNINFFILAAIAVAMAMAFVFFIVQRNANPPINVNTQGTKEQSVDTVLVQVPSVDTKAPVEESVINSNSPVKLEKPASEQEDSSALKTSKKVVHWMIILTAQETRRLAQKLIEQGDSLWEEHTRAEIGSWVDTQTELVPELRNDCHEKIEKSIEQIKRGGRS